MLRRSTRSDNSAVRTSRQRRPPGSKYRYLPRMRAAASTPVTLPVAEKGARGTVRCQSFGETGVGHGLGHHSVIVWRRGKGVIVPF